MIVYSHAVVFAIILLPKRLHGKLCATFCESFLLN